MGALSQQLPRRDMEGVMLYSLSKDKIRLRSVLLPLVTVEDQSISDLFFLFGLLQSFAAPGRPSFPVRTDGQR